MILALLATAVALGALVTAVSALLVGRQWQARSASLELSIDALRRELELVASISARTGLRVQRMEQEYSGVADRVDVVESRGSAVAAAGSLDLAIELARHGADSNKIAEHFGLSPGEADLVARLHGQKKTA